MSFGFFFPIVSGYFFPCSSFSKFSIKSRFFVEEALCSSPFPCCFSVTKVVSAWTPEIITLKKEELDQEAVLRNRELCE